MIRRVLIPLDGSEMAESMVFRLGFLLRQTDARVTLLSVVDAKQKGWLTHAAVTASDLEGELVEGARAYIEAMADKLRATGLEVHAKVEVGGAAEIILAVAEEEQSSVICMSTHGRTGLSRWVYGSVTEKVVRASVRPVLVVPSFSRTEPEGGVDRRVWNFTSVVVPLDGSRQALQIIPHVAEGVRLFGSRVTLLLVLEDHADPNLLELAEKHLEGAVALFEKAGVIAHTELRRGDPAVEVLDYTPRYDHDMIAMTTHGRSGVSRWMLGSVAEKVLRRATVPVLVVRTTEDTVSPTRPADA